MIKVRVYLFTIFFILFSVFSGEVFCGGGGSEDDAKSVSQELPDWQWIEKKLDAYNKTVDTGGISEDASIVSQDTPEWLKRVEFSTEYETDKHPTFYFQTVQPLYESFDNAETVFYQPRVSLRAGDLTYNLGVGYRNVVSDNLLLGCNLFGDYQDLHEHARLGIGLEALGQVLEARLNSYLGVLTTKRVVEENASSTTYERVADGLDFELGAPVPHLPWLKFYSSGFWYDFDKFSDKKGWKSRLEAKPTECLALELYTWDDNKGEQEYGGKVRFNVAFDKLSDFKEIFKRSDKSFPKKDLKKQLLIPVERNFDIVVEKWTESKIGGVAVEIKRGN